jgi:hypothetical protein
VFYLFFGVVDARASPVSLEFWVISGPFFGRMMDGVKPVEEVIDIALPQEVIDIAVEVPPIYRGLWKIVEAFTTPFS